MPSCVAAARPVDIDHSGRMMTDYANNKVGARNHDLGPQSSFEDQIGASNATLVGNAVDLLRGPFEDNVLPKFIANQELQYYAGCR